MEELLIKKKEKKKKLEYGGTTLCEHYNQMINKVSAYQEALLIRKGSNTSSLILQRRCDSLELGLLVLNNDSYNLKL